MQSTLKHAAPRIEQLVEGQRNLMKNSRTASKRLRKFHRFVEQQERQRLGKVGAEAARASVARAPANECGDLEVFGASAGEPRSEPLLAVVGMRRCSSPVGRQVAAQRVEGGEMQTDEDQSEEQAVEVEIDRGLLAEIMSKEDTATAVGNDASWQDSSGDTELSAIAAVKVQKFDGECHEDMSRPFLTADGGSDM